ncbi:HAD-IIIC family phosphatase [Actinoallomurus soli]|uniref:HAD-IIIC family phosphatase n=1 Tax=Actinoallomurus soli TaxID=2952535 RepID=UPI0020933EC7|nr:HAD-IIIC family phosphatase [Actinoallomurus soli]MCO5974057.1 HAD-IIIC family phosphatase [Actinoallomurus soli]
MASREATTGRNSGSATDFFGLFRAGDLAVRYPEVPALLAGLDGLEMIRAGQLLSRLDPAAVLSAHPGTKTIRVAITGHGEVAQLQPALTAELARHGLLARSVVAPFDSYIFDLADPASRLYADRPDITICLLDATVVFDEVPVPWCPEDVRRVFSEKLRTFEQIAATFAMSGHGTLVLNTMPLPYQSAAQLVDYRSRAALGVLWREGNAELLRLMESNPALVVLDLEPMAEDVRLTDQRLRVYASAPFTTELTANYAREIGHLASGLAGQGRKCLVLDLDGTIWDGVLGEDGVDGIAISDSYRGQAFQTFQQIIKQLGARGVLLAVVSKNEASVVREALRDRPDMTLREEDFVRIVANWRPKHENLAEIAQALNLGLDSFVFVDDSPYECGLVRRELPAVAVICVDGDPALHAGRLLRDGWFSTRDSTDEDRGRTARYRDELVRKDFLDSFESIEDYLRELQIVVRVRSAESGDVPRLSQLTLRTNQFNLTTRRMQQSEVSALLQDPGWMVLAINASDRFGDKGLVGAIFARRQADVIYIDNFVLSCRVFSRGIEQGCLAALLDHAIASGVTAVFGEYRPTAKNGIVGDLYPRYGFRPVPAATIGDKTARFRHDLREPLERPVHLQMEEDFSGGLSS